MSNPQDDLQIPRNINPDCIGAGTDTSHMEYWGDKGVQDHDAVVASPESRKEMEAKLAKDGTNTDTWLDLRETLLAYDVRRPDGTPNEKEIRMLIDALKSKLTTKMESVRNDYEQKIQDLTVETRVHSKVFEWTHTGSPYVGDEAIGYKSAQEDIEKLLPKWRAEALAELQAHHKQEDKS